MNLSRTFMKTLLLAGLAVGPCAVQARVAPDQDLLDFEKGVSPFLSVVLPEAMKGRVAADVLHDTHAGAARTGRGALRFHYLRRQGAFPVLYAPLSLGGLQTIDFDARAEDETILALAIEDLDGAKFHSVVQLPAGAWKHVQVRASDFKPSDDSPVKKAVLDPELAKQGIGFLDAKALMPGPEKVLNLYIDNLRVFRGMIAQRTGGWRVTRDTAVTTPALIEGDVTVEKNATLLLRGTRVRLKGNVLLKPGATLRVEDTLLDIPGTYHYQYRLVAEEGARVEMLGTRMQLAKPWDLALQEGATWQATRTEFPLGNVTTTAAATSVIELTDVQKPGEMVLAPGAKVQLKNVRDVLVWFHLLPGKTDQLALPEGAYLKSWQAPADQGFQVGMENVLNAMWGLVAHDGARVKVPGTQLRTSSFLMKGETTRTIRDLRNGQAYGAEPVRAGDAELSLNGSKVQTWNLYGFDQATLNVEGCHFGEAIAFKSATLNVRDSVCDGTGGYFGARDQAVVTATKCKLIGGVVAQQQSTLRLVDCEILGDVTAADTSKVELVRCKVTGGVNATPGAKLSQR